MASDGYIKAAHSQLTSAVTNLQSEIAELERQLRQEIGNTETNITQIDKMRAVHMAEISSQNHDDAQHQYLLKRMDTLSHEKNDKQEHISRLNNDISSQIQAKRQALGAIQGAAGQIEGLQSLPGIR